MRRCTFEGAGPHRSPPPFLVGRISADLAHKGGAIGLALKLQRSIPFLLVPPELDLGGDRPPSNPLPSAQSPPSNPRRAFGAVCVALFPCWFPGPTFFLLFGDGARLLARPPVGIHPGKQKTGQGAHLGRRGRQSLAGLKPFQLATLALRTHPGLSVLGLPETGFAPRLLLREAPLPPPLGLGNDVGAWIELDSGL